jgi:predicted transcriptional regulator of viral defense system
MNYFQQIIQLIQEKGIIRPQDVEAIGIARVYLHRLYQQGVVERAGRGLYRLPDAPVDSHHSFAEVIKRCPKGVISILSALEFHQLTTQLPFEVWLTIEANHWKPRIDYPPTQIIYVSGDAFQYGIETHTISGVPVPIYGVAKTIADCFKFRNKIGLDVALEALKQVVHEKRVTIDALWQSAQVCRISSVMKPYLEALA